jgi:acyl-CoA reductase-like NAD-dependent aldehyde dehydrogenase
VLAALPPPCVAQCCVRQSSSHTTGLTCAAAARAQENKEPMVSTLVAEVAKPAKDAATEVVRSADLMHYAAEEGVRLLAEGKLLTSDAFPGNDRNKLCMVSKIPLGVRALGEMGRDRL